MHGIYILIEKSSESDHSGIGLKIRNQIKAFEDAGIDIEEIVLPIKRTRMLSVLYRLPFTNVYPVWKYHKEFENADLIYMRRPFVMNSSMRKVLRDIKTRNPRAKIIVEIPTYPYDDEYSTYRANKMLLIKDKYNRWRMRGLIDRYANLGSEREIFGVPTIHIKNGINIDKVKVKRPTHSKNSINICAVAAFKEWHGYERFIEGLYTYYDDGGQRNIICHFVGDGSELNRYKSLVTDYKLDKHFIFYGYLTGEDLDNIYDKCSLSLGSFGMYKKNNYLSCDLKSREAVARGIPMVTGCRTDIFIKDKYKYFLEFPNDSTPIDIKKVIDFYDEIYKDGEENVITRIREYAYQNVGMDNAMKDVIDYIKE